MCVRLFAHSSHFTPSTRGKGLRSASSHRARVSGILGTVNQRGPLMRADYRDWLQIKSCVVVFPVIKAQTGLSVSIIHTFTACTGRLRVSIQIRLKEIWTEMFVPAGLLINSLITLSPVKLRCRSTKLKEKSFERWKQRSAHEGGCVAHHCCTNNQM